MKGGKEGLPRRAVTPMSSAAVFIPHVIVWLRSVVVRLGVVGREIASCAQIFREVVHAGGKWMVGELSSVMIQRIFGRSILWVNTAGGDIERRANKATGELHRVNLLTVTPAMANLSGYIADRVRYPDYPITSRKTRWMYSGKELQGATGTGRSNRGMTNGQQSMIDIFRSAGPATADIHFLSRR